MGRKRKNNPSPKEESELISSDQENPEPEQVEDEIENHETPKSSFGDLMSRARDNLVSSGSDEPAKPSKWSKYKSSKNKSEVTTAISSLLVLFIASWKVPNELKPNEDETNAISNYATRLLLRHVDLSGRLTADAIDVIGIIAVASGYYARTAANWREYRDLQAATVLDVSPRSKETILRRPEKDQPIQGPADPIQNIDPNAAEFLNRPRGGDPQ